MRVLRFAAETPPGSRDQLLHALEEDVGVGALDLHGGHWDDVLALFGPHAQRAGDFLAAGRLLDRDDPRRGRQPEACHDPLHHFQGGADDEDAPEVLGRENAARIRNLVGIREHGRAHGADDALLALGRPARDDRAVPDEQTVVDDELDVVPLCDCPGLVALAGAAATHERVHLRAARQPGQEPREQSGGTAPPRFGHVNHHTRRAGCGKRPARVFSFRPAVRRADAGPSGSCAPSAPSDG